MKERCTEVHRSLYLFCSFALDELYYFHDGDNSQSQSDGDTVLGEADRSEAEETRDEGYLYH